MWCLNENKGGRVRGLKGVQSQWKRRSVEKTKEKRRGVSWVKVEGFKIARLGVEQRGAWFGFAFTVHGSRCSGLALVLLSSSSPGSSSRGCFAPLAMHLSVEAWF